MTLERLGRMELFEFCPDRPCGNRSGCNRIDPSRHGAVSDLACLLTSRAPLTQFRDSASDRITASMDASSNRPMTAPTLCRWTDIALSIWICEGLSRPFCGLGWTVRRISSASTSVAEISRTVIVPV